MIELRDCQHQIDTLCRQLWPGSTDAPTATPRRVAHQRPTHHRADEAVLDRMLGSKNGAAIRRLYDGDTSAYGGDDSRADLALCSHLAFWTRGDAAQMDWLFRCSGLFREKWEREDYRMRTIGKACESLTRVEGSFRGRGSRRGRADEGSDRGSDLGSIDAETGATILHEKQTLPTARAFLAACFHHPEGRCLHLLDGRWVEWSGSAYRMLEQTELEARLYEWLSGCVHRSEGKERDFQANPRSVGDVVRTLEALASLSAAQTTPFWIEERSGDPPANELFVCRSGPLHVPTGVALEPSPRLMALNPASFDYEPYAPTPPRWSRFLAELFGDDSDSVQLLQEYFGSVLVGDNRYQKALLVIGPPRSGKGTIGSVLESLLGSARVVRPTTGSLCNEFGLQPLLGKSLAVMSDARFCGSDAGTFIERFLNITGDDPILVNRKHAAAVTVRLGTRFVILSNEAPRLLDASGAVVSRLLTLRLTRQFLGSEQHDLLKELRGEMSGIFAWAVRGLQSLRERGRFRQPDSGFVVLEAVRDLGSPIGRFVAERCVVAPGERIDSGFMHREYQAWCHANGEAAKAPHLFGRDLASAFPSVQSRRGTGDLRFYDGITIQPRRDR